MVTIHFYPDILSVVTLRFTVRNFTQMFEIKLTFLIFLAKVTAARINQQLGVGPPSSAPPPAEPKPGPHQGLGMVVK